MNRWNSVQYAQFRAKVSTEHEATGNCIDYLIAHRKDLPDHMNNDASLLERIRQIFKHLPWCMTLYERTTPNQDPNTFGELLKTAASNFDEHQKNKITESTPSFPVQSATKDTSSSISEMVATFFAKTSPPPNHRRPFRYRRNSYPNRYVNRYGNRGSYDRGRSSRYSSWKPRYPSQLAKRRCFGCNMEGHILRNCPEKHKYRNRLNNLKQVGTAAVMLIEALDQEPTDDMAEVATFIADFMDGITDEIHESDDSEEFDTRHSRFQLIRNHDLLR